jgi:hypothetical protein
MWHQFGIRALELWGYPGKRAMKSVLECRAFQAALAMLLFSSTAQATEVTGVRVTEQGIYECARETGRQRAPGTPSDEMNISAGCELVTATNRVPARLGTRFGCRYIVDGAPENADVAMTIRWKFPPQGLKDQGPGQRYFWADYNWTSRLGNVTEFKYRFDDQWELVPGPWTMEIRYGARKLAECRFDVVAE